MYLKQGVEVDGVQPEIVMAMFIAFSVYQQIEKELVVTSVKDGVHSPASLHYTGNAVDIRTRHLSPEQIEWVGAALKERLGSHYDVVVHNSHIHIEYQPKFYGAGNAQET